MDPYEVVSFRVGRKVVDYNDHYRGMQSVVLDGLEAYADIILNPDRHGTWHTPPHWIDSIFHIGGFVLNGSEASNTKDYFYVTSGWGSRRIIQPLVAGGRYRRYVHMAPIEEKNMYAGDVYVLQDGVVVAMMGEIKFRRVPRLLMNQFFSPSDATSSKAEEATVPTSVASPSAPVAVSAAQASMAEPATPSAAPVADPAPVTKVDQQSASTQKQKTVSTSDSPVVTDCLKILACESGLDPSELVDSATFFVELGVDSLMSLVLSQKIKSELGLGVKSSVFIECPNIGDLG